jgi:hypothetical protein
MLYRPDYRSKRELKMKMRRVLVRVIRNDICKSGFVFCIPSWDKAKEITIRRNSLPTEIAFVKPGTRLFVLTNLGEEEADRLTFSNWEFAPPPLSEAELEALAK